MNNKLRGVLLLVIAFVLIIAGIVAVYFLTRQAGVLPSVGGISPTAVPDTVRSPAVVVTHDMKLGDVIKAEDVSVVQMPADMLPRDVLTDATAVVGKYIKVDLVQGEMLLEHNIADPTNKNGDIAYILSQEHVLMAISFDDVMTQQGLPKRGDLVDVFVTKSESVTIGNIPGVSGETSPVPESGTGDTTGQVTRPFTFDAMQNLGITALVADVVTTQQSNSVAERVNQTNQPTQAAPSKTVIRAYLLALKPQDALVLKFFKDNGAVFDLVLRNPTSTQSFDLTPVTEEYIIELYGLEILK